MNERPFLDDGTSALRELTLVLDDASTIFQSGGRGAAASYQPGDIIDGVYELRQVLGRGGMGVVYSCRHNVLDADCALKLLYGEELTEASWERFKSEAKALARLKHPGIVGIYNMGVDKGKCPYFVMDLLSGESLDTVLRRQGGLPVSQVLDLFIGVADALHSAHTKNIIHRDVKPSNMMLVRDPAGRIDCIKIVDFGIARISTAGHTLQNQSQTKTGAICGTPMYMSPEQWQGEKSDARSDIYSYGCTLFEALTGAPPFTGDNTFHTFMLHQNMEPPNLSAVAKGLDFPPSLEQAVKKMLAKDADSRYQSMAQVKHDLERIRAGKPIVAEGMWNEHVSAEAGKSVASFSIGRREITSAILTALIILITGTALSLHFARSTSRGGSALPSTITPLAAAPSMGQELPDQLGATIEEVDSLVDQGTCADEQCDLFTALIRPLLADPEWRARKFRVEKPAQAFVFPKGFAVGAIQIGDGMPVMARGIVPAPEGKKVSLFLPRIVADNPLLMDKFGESDITGINAIFGRPRDALNRLSKWNRLEELSFFNPLLKALPSCEKWDESDLCDDDLPAIDKLHGLKSLGLCGPRVTGSAICQMAILNNLEVLKLKRVSDLPPLLKVLPYFDNIKEIWLVSEELTDDQIKFLARMKCVQTVRIRRSRLTPACLETFSKMPSLKQLWLDRNTWSKEDRDHFKQVIPGCHFEKVMDGAFWRITQRAR